MAKLSEIVSRCNEITKIMHIMSYLITGFSNETIESKESHLCAVSTHLIVEEIIKINNQGEIVEDDMKCDCSKRFCVSTFCKLQPLSYEKLMEYMKEMYGEIKHGEE